MQNAKTEFAARLKGEWCDKYNKPARECEHCLTVARVAIAHEMTKLGLTPHEVIDWIYRTPKKKPTA